MRCNELGKSVITGFENMHVPSSILVIPIYDLNMLSHVFEFMK